MAIKLPQPRIFARGRVGSQIPVGDLSQCRQAAKMFLNAVKDWLMKSQELQRRTTESAWKQ
jgi:hypothetical protein